MKTRDASSDDTVETTQFQQTRRTGNGIGLYEMTTFLDIRAQKEEERPVALQPLAVCHHHLSSDQHSSPMKMIEFEDEAPFCFRARLPFGDVSEGSSCASLSTRSRNEMLLCDAERPPSLLDKTNDERRLYFWNDFDELRR